MPKKHPITTDQLAGMVQRGFEEVRTEMGVFRHEMNERLYSIENRLDALEANLMDIKRKLENVIYRHEFERLEKRMDVAEKEIASLRKR